jgi:hypothetical protein
MTKNFSPALDFSNNFLQTLIKYREYCNEHALNESQELTNTMQFLVMANLDLTTLMNEIIDHDSNSWKKTLNARMLALIIYEYLDDVPRIINATFLSSAAKVLIDDSYKNAFKMSNNQLNIIKQKHYTFLGQIRNKTIAHKELESQNLINLINQVDCEEIFYIAGEIAIHSFPIVEQCNIIYENLMKK